MADIIVVHGTPGAGKTTHCENLSQLTLGGKEICHISVGNRLRAIRNGEIDSMFSVQVNAADAPAPLDHGVVNGIVFEYVSVCPDNSIVLVDGYPRFTDAIDPFMDSIKEGNHSLLGCINLNISRETSINRLTIRGGRKGERIFTDDFREERLADYLSNTAESIDAFRKFTRVIDVNAESGEDVVWELYVEAFRELVQDKQIR